MNRKKSKHRFIRESPPLINNKIDNQEKSTRHSKSTNGKKDETVFILGNIHRNKWVYVG